MMTAATSQDGRGRARLLSALTVAEYVVEAGAFLPVAYTWWALGRALEASERVPGVGDSADAPATFLEGWRSGFGDPDARWALDEVALNDALIIAIIAVLFVVVRTARHVVARRQPDESGAEGVLRQATAVANTAVAEAARASDAAMQLSRDARGDLVAVREAIAASVDDAQRRVAQLEGVASELAATASQAQGLYVPLTALNRSLDDIGAEVKGMADAVASGHEAAEQQRQTLEKAVQAAIVALEGMSDSHVAFAREIRNLSDSERRAWEQAGVQARSVENVTKHTLAMSRDLVRVVDALRQGVERGRGEGR